MLRRTLSGSGEATDSGALVVYQIYNSDETEIVLSGNTTLSSFGNFSVRKELTFEGSTVDLIVIAEDEYQNSTQKVKSVQFVPVVSNDVDSSSRSSGSSGGGGGLTKASATVDTTKYGDVKVEQIVRNNSVNATLKASEDQVGPDSIVTLKAKDGSAELKIRAQTINEILSDDASQKIQVTINEQKVTTETLPDPKQDGYKLKRTKLIC